MYGISLDSTKNIYGAGLGSNIFSPPISNPSSSLAFWGADGQDYSSIMNGDFSSTLQLFNMYMGGQLPFDFMGTLFDTNFNTKTDLPSLKNVYNPKLGNKLANIANQNAQSRGTKKLCLQGVRTTLEKAGLKENGSMGGSAFQADKVLSRNKNFKEVGVSRDDLKNLPAGCVVVWQPSDGHPHGHIAVTLGNGKEASDHVQNQIVRNTGYSVFVPVGISKSA